MFAKIEAWFRQTRARSSRSEWAIRNLGLTPSTGTSEAPGLLLIQIDGLARTQVERAIASGRMPFLKKLLNRENYRMHDFYPGMPSTTPAVQAELYYGLRAAVPAFSFFDRVKKEHGLMAYPEWAKDFEASYAAQAEGLMKDGSCWSNIYTGGAKQEESHFCGASLGWRDMWRSGAVLKFFAFLIMNFVSVIKIIVLMLVELVLAFCDVIVGLKRGERFIHEVHMALSRAVVAIGLREVVKVGVSIDLTRGLPVIHMNFLGYDEQSHRRGPGSRFAHWSLRGIDRYIKNLYYTAQGASRRDYAVWVFSDHGQERTESFALKFPGGVERIVHECLEDAQKLDHAWRPRSQRRPAAPWMRSRRRRSAQAQLTPQEEATFTIASMGPVGHVYFTHKPEPAKLHALALRLIAKDVPGVMLRSEAGKLQWLHAGGAIAVPEEVPAFLAKTHSEPVRNELAQDLVAFAENPHSGDIILMGWSPDKAPWSFAPEHGAHGGPGPEETRGFVLLPRHTRLPKGTEHFIRPAALRAAALNLLGRGKLEMEKIVPVSGDVVALRVMTYNTHSCSGVDGRVSPKRIARVIANSEPDIVALQELDLGKRRSRAEDQAALIASELEMQYVFCPTVTRDGEHYGHALLSRWPIEVVKRAFLPSAPGSWWPEPRSALWARVIIGARRVNIFTTHLGLGLQERQLQMQALMGEEWVGAVPPEEEIIVCGDFNCTPGSKPYRLAASKLRDIQKSMPGYSPLSTFTSLRPFTRIDHIFVSPALVPQKITVPRNALTRVASDHLPLVVDLLTETAAAETPARKTG
ncbi:endonuclease/exonuclease/phosphatase family protein [Oleiharenicola lentus]|uniref:endonuclease/exonuclease/phosphatase family protein n=1 Tax=Oleiharenicola lentus TaxID=2508720 RepID=UPI003F660EF2